MDTGIKKIEKPETMIDKPEGPEVNNEKSVLSSSFNFKTP